MVNNCRICGKTFSRYTECEKHENQAHPILCLADGSFKCPMCGMSYKSKLFLHYHMVHPPCNIYWTITHKNLNFDASSVAYQPKSIQEYNAMLRNQNEKNNSLQPPKNHLHLTYQDSFPSPFIYPAQKRNLSDVTMPTIINTVSNYKPTDNSGSISSVFIDVNTTSLATKNRSIKAKKRRKVKSKEESSEEEEEENEPTIHCDQCKKEFYNESYYQRHKKRCNAQDTSSRLPHKCGSCTKYFATTTTLNEHQEYCMTSLAKISEIEDDSDNESSIVSDDEEEDDDDDYVVDDDDSSSSEINTKSSPEPKANSDGNSSLDMNNTQLISTFKVNPITCESKSPVVFSSARHNSANARKTQMITSLPFHNNMQGFQSAVVDDNNREKMIYLPTNILPVPISFQPPVILPQQFLHNSNTGGGPLVIVNPHVVSHPQVMTVPNIVSTPFVVIDQRTNESPFSIPVTSTKKIIEPRTNSQSSVSIKDNATQTSNVKVDAINDDLPILSKEWMLQRC